MPIHIDPALPFKSEIDLTGYVQFKGDRYSCTACGEVLVRVEPNGILGDTLNALDTTVILDHHMALHS